MCIIAIKKSGVKMPSDDTITTMWTNNPDGAGFMYAKDGKVYIEKGFMQLDSLLKRLHQLAGCLDVTETPFVLHLRITTHGGTSPENCHPFPISNNVSVLQKPSMPTDVGVAHNGIIPITPRPKISDTMEYIVTQLAYIKRYCKQFYLNKNCMKLIENAIHSKMVFLAADGTITTIGSFQDHEGVLYSNSSYEPRVSFSYYDTYLLGEGGCRSTGAQRRAIATVKPLMLISDSGTDATIKEGSTGDLADAYNFAIDAKGRLYEMDWETGCAFRSKDHSIIGKVTFNAKFAAHCDCYGSSQDLFADVYGSAPGMPW